MAIIEHLMINEIIVRNQKYYHCGIARRKA